MQHYWRSHKNINIWLLTTRFWHIHGLILNSNFDTLDSFYSSLFKYFMLQLTSFEFFMCSSCSGISCNWLALLDIEHVSRKLSLKGRLFQKRIGKSVCPPFLTPWHFFFVKIPREVGKEPWRNDMGSKLSNTESSTLGKILLYYSVFTYSWYQSAALRTTTT